MATFGEQLLSKTWQVKTSFYTIQKQLYAIESLIRWQDKLSSFKESVSAYIFLFISFSIESIWYVSFSSEVPAL